MDCFLQSTNQPDIIVVKLSKPSVKPAESISKADLMVIDEPDQELVFDWMNLIRMFLSNHPLSDDEAEVERITCTSKMYHLIDGVLYQQGANGMMMQCISRCHIPKFSFWNVNHFSHKKLKISKKKNSFILT
jgi:hypothetical protein